MEVLKKLHPELCFYLFDIPPQLYVCEQYLKAVFPGCVVSYRDTRDLITPPVEPGKIFIWGNWKFPILEQVQIDLFWNSASFQEMEPDVVANYLKYVNNQAKRVFLMEVMGGQKVAKKRGDHGVLKQTTLKNYLEGLSNLKLVDLFAQRVIPNISRDFGCSYAYWERI